MHILFISSGNKKNGISPIIKNQGDSLVSLGHQVSYFTIQGKGFMGYLRNVFILRNYIKDNPFDIIHAHYSLSAVVATLAGGRSIVVSLMGSDVKAKNILKYIIKLFAFLFWKKIIVKSTDMKNSLNLKDVHVVPNGVNFERFQPINKEKSLNIVQWNYDKKHLLFAADPERKEKNFQLAKEAFEILKDKRVEMHSLADVPNELVPYHLNAADVVLLTSLWEGSPNIIKEAMSCNIPVIATNVGDVKELISNVSGCFISSFDSRDLAHKMVLALKFAEETGRTEGRKQIIKLNLNSEAVAKAIIEIYEKK